jgi:glyoxylate reductase
MFAAVAMLPQPRVLFFNPVHHALVEYATLSKVAQTEMVSSKSRAEFFADVETKYSDIRAIYRTSASGAVRHSSSSIFNISQN